MTAAAPATAVDRLLAAVEAGHPVEDGVLDAHAVLDAVVPNWHFTVRSATAVTAELARWFADPGRFESLRRTPLPEGELVEFDLSWEEGGVPHACRQVHRLTLRDGRIVEDAAWCGGRWPASLLAEMAEAEHGGAG